MATTSPSLDWSRRFCSSLAWTILQPLILQSSVSSLISQEQIEEAGSLGLVMSDVRRVAEGLDIAVAEGAMDREMAEDLRTDFTNVRDRLGEVGVALGSDVNQETLRAAQAYRASSATGNLLKTIAVLLISIGGTAFAYAYTRTNKDFRARNTVETAVRYSAAPDRGCIHRDPDNPGHHPFALIFNTVEFFGLYPDLGVSSLGLTWAAKSFSGRGGCFRAGLYSAALGHALHLGYRASGCGAYRPLLLLMYLSEYASPESARPLPSR